MKTRKTTQPIMKPKSCRECPAVRIKKGELQCGVMHELKATRTEEEFCMWKKCPLVWDK